jgi:hypothetical protein
MEQRCLHEMLPGQCAICSRHPDDQLYDTKAQLDPTHDGHHVVVARSEATWPFRCSGCGTSVRVGDAIILSLADAVFVCVSCGEGT